MSVEMILAIISAVLASSGLWAFVTTIYNSKQKKHNLSESETKMLIGLAHDRIISLGLMYIDRGEITQDEYENLYEYLYKPYRELGGNGSAERVMEEVKRLKIKIV